MHACSDRLTDRFEWRDVLGSLASVSIIVMVVYMAYGSVLPHREVGVFVSDEESLGMAVAPAVEAHSHSLRDVFFFFFFFFAVSQ